MFGNGMGKRGAVVLGGVALAAMGAGLLVALPEAAEAAPPAAVTVQQFQYMPPDLSVMSGATVQWTNQDDIIHTVTSGAPSAPDGKFDGPMDGAGKTFSHQFTAPGTYTYYCSRHESMTGKVTVT